VQTPPYQLSTGLAFGHHSFEPRRGNHYPQTPIDFIGFSRFWLKKMPAEYVPTADQRALVENAAAFGITQADIAEQLKIDEKTLRTSRSASLC
jgi:hypothetical protein